MATVTITWHSHHDGHTCKVCEEVLDGYSWTFDIEQGVPSVLDVSGYPVWDVASGSAVHNDKGTCRCWLTADFDFSDWVELVEDYCERIMQARAMTASGLEAEATGPAYPEAEG